MGAPLSSKTAASLEKAMQESISLQPYVREVEVHINRDMLAANVFGYSELQGRMIEAWVVIDYQGETVTARLQYDREKDYPLMSMI